MAVSGYSLEATCQHGMVQSLLRYCFKTFTQPDNRTNEVFRMETFVGSIEPFFHGFLDSCLFSTNAKDAQGGQAFVVRGPLLVVLERPVCFCDDGHYVYKSCNQFAI